MSPSSIDEAVSLSYVGLVQAMTASVNSMRANRPVMNLEAGADAEALGGRWQGSAAYWLAPHCLFSPLSETWHNQLRNRTTHGGGGGGGLYLLTSITNSEND